MFLSKAVKTGVAPLALRGAEPSGTSSVSFSTSPSATDDSLWSARVRDKARSEGVSLQDARDRRFGVEVTKNVEDAERRVFTETLKRLPKALFSPP